MGQVARISGRTTKITKGKDGSLAIRYHQTDVVLVAPDGTIVLNTGGWNTNTTKNRMNQASSQFNLGYQVWQENGKWFVRWNKKVILFDGIRLVLKPGGGNKVAWVEN